MPSDAQPASTTDASRVVAATFVLNALLFVAAFVVYLASRSQLVLAQGADSLFDLAAGAVLTVSATIGNKPRDADHPFGHERAEPIGALVTAILAGVLAFEVLRSSIGALIAGSPAELDSPVALVLGAKFGAKALMLGFLVSRSRKSRSSALRATFVDTRNDVVACASSLVGYGLARAGWPEADAVLAIPVAVYIGFSGVELARENLRYLMGEAPDAEVIAEIRRTAAGVRGVLDVRRIRAQFVGPLLHVEVTVLIGEDRTATQGHDLALDVQSVVEAHPLVGEAFVHVDTRAARDHA